MRLRIRQILLCYILRLSASAQSIETIHITNDCASNQLFFFFYHDQFRDLQNSLVLKDNVALEIKDYDIKSNPRLVIFNISSDFYPVFLKPGDSISVKCNFDSPKYVFAGRDAGELNFLPRLEKKFGFFLPQMTGIKMTNKIHFDYFAAENKRIYDSRMNYLKQNADSLHFSREYVENISNILRYKYIRGLLSPYDNKEDKDFSWKKIPSSYVSLLKELQKEIYQSNNSTSTEYESLTKQPTNSLEYELMLKSLNIFQARDSINGNISHDFGLLYHEGKKIINDTQKDIVLFHLLKDYTSRGIADIALYVQDFKTTCTNFAYVKYIDSVFQRSRPQSVSEDLTTLFLKDQTATDIPFRDIVKSNLGNVVYIDFWASWCGPCLGEMPISKQLEEKFKNDPVKFLFVSTDFKIEAWLQAIQKNNLRCDKCEHYSVDDKSPLANYFAVHSIPRYVLIDKKGRIIKNAPRPSDQTVAAKIRSLLDE